VALAARRAGSGTHTMRQLLRTLPCRVRVDSGATARPSAAVRLSSSAAACAAAAPDARLARSQRAALLDRVNTFVFDCDGVIWRGEAVIDGVPETLDMLRARGKRLIFLTNNSTKSREGYRAKFESLGIDVRAEEIFASSFAAAAYLSSRSFPSDKKVYIVGHAGIQQVGPLQCLNGKSVLALNNAGRGDSAFRSSTWQGYNI
jgi:hypothetical protein